MLDYIFFASIVAVSLFALTLLVRFRLIKNVRRDHLRYKLFAVRDQLIRLVAQKELAEDDFTFQEFYSMVNISIKHIDAFTLREITRVARQHRHTLEQEENFDKLIDELDHKTGDVKLVVNRFFLTMIEILIAKSIFLRILRRLFSIFRTQRTNEFYEASKPNTRIPKYSNVFIERSESYQAFNFYQNYPARLGLVTA